MKLVCKIHREWGEKVFVANQLFTIGTDGTLEVPDDVAELLLQNKNKWADPAAPVRTPGRKPTATAHAPADPADRGPPPVVMKDRSGRVLSDDETWDLIDQATAEREQQAPPPAVVDDLEEAAKVIGKQHGTGDDAGAAVAGEQATTDPLAAQLGQAKAAEVDAEIQAQRPEPSDADIEPEAPPADWPEVSMKSTVPELDAVIERLLTDGWELDLGDGKKAAKLEAIESAYDLMEAGAEE